MSSFGSVLSIYGGVDNSQAQLSDGFHVDVCMVRVDAVTNCFDYSDAFLFWLLLLLAMQPQCRATIKSQTVGGMADISCQSLFIASFSAVHNGLAWLLWAVNNWIFCHLELCGSFS